MSAVASVERDLRAAVAAEVVAPTAAYLTDMTEARGLSGRADAVALPRTAEEVAEVVGWCYAHGVAIVPRGGGTGYAGGAVALNGGVVLSLERLDRVRSFDPLIVDGDHAALDELAGRRNQVTILTTLKFHRRSRGELAQRYGAGTTAPAGVEPIEIAGSGETMYWIPAERTLVTGDRILGDRPPGLRMCPERWLRYLGGYTQEDLRAGLQPLLDLPVEMVLVSHGEPVLRDGHAALKRALA